MRKCYKIFGLVCVMGVIFVSIYNLKKKTLATFFNGGGGGGWVWEKFFFYTFVYTNDLVFMKHNRKYFF